MIIKAAAFDYGGVISLPQEPRDMEEMASLAGTSVSLMRRVYWENRSDYDRGRTGGEEYFAGILSGLGIFPGKTTLEQLVERDLQSWARVSTETAHLMDDVKKAGLQLGLLSNMVQPFLDRIQKTLPVLKLPDVSVYSCELGMVKPERKIYEILLAALRCKASELVFFDDSQVNVDGALELGIHAFLWEGAARARRELELLCERPFGEEK